MKVLITGGAGYIGSNVVYFLLDKGFEVEIIDNFTTGSRQYLPEGLKIHELDINIETCPVSQFQLSGGSVHCLTNEI